MEQIERLEALSPLLTAQLKKGVFTNNFLSQEAYGREITQGLFVHAFAGGLLLFRRRERHWVLNFYLQPDAALELPPLQKPVVVELPWRSRDAEAADAVQQRMEAAGFRELFRRCRRQRLPAPAEAEALAVSFPGPEAAAQILHFLEGQFDSLTGCLPSMDALRQILQNREVAAILDEGGVAGVLHFSRGRAATEIRHLAVGEPHRGKGMAAALLDAYLQETDGKKSRVWARQGNAPAERFYEKHGYRPDGWQSAVLAVRGKETV